MFKDKDNPAITVSIGTKIPNNIPKKVCTIDTLQGFLSSLSEVRYVSSGYSHGSMSQSVQSPKLKSFKLPQKQDVFCPICKAKRKCTIEHYDDSYKISQNEEGTYSYSSLPMIYRASCLQCNSNTLLIIYKGPESEDLIVLYDTYGGCVTDNTPDGVKYYLDQAHRAKSVSAFSAAMAMYRSALEWILHEQGYVEGMLNNKIKNLKTAIDKGTAPKWARDLPEGLLNEIKEIGNGAMHTNNGDLSKQKVLDKESIGVVDIVFIDLLDKIYEEPIRTEDRSSDISKLEDVFKRKQK